MQLKSRERWQRHDSKDWKCVDDIMTDVYLIIGVDKYALNCCRDLVWRTKNVPVRSAQIGLSRRSGSEDQSAYRPAENTDTIDVELAGCWTAGPQNGEDYVKKTRVISNVCMQTKAKLISAPERDTRRFVGRRYCARSCVLHRGH